MRLHRFYVNPEIQELTHVFWLKDKNIRHQWLKVFRYDMGAEVVLFDGIHEKQYVISDIAEDAIKVTFITEREAQRSVTSGKKVLLFSLLKKDNNELIIQKCTELGITHFVPMITDRTIVREIDEERMSKIAIEAAEQCGRTDVPVILEACSLSLALQKHIHDITLYYAEKTVKQSTTREVTINHSGIGVCVGPEGGWTKDEIVLLSKTAEPLMLSMFTLRAETAAIVAASFMGKTESRVS